MLGNYSNAKKLFISLSILSLSTDCAQLLVDALESLPLIHVAVTIVSSPESDPKSY